MSDVEKNNTTPPVGDDNVFDNLDLVGIMNAQKAKKEDAAGAGAGNTTSNAGTTATVGASQYMSVSIGPGNNRKPSPVEELLKEQRKDVSKGLVVDNVDLEQKPKELRNPFDSDLRRSEFKAALDEGDDKLVKRQAVVQIKQADNPAAMAELEDELESVCFDEEGKPYFDYKDTNAVGETKVLTPKYFVIRTPDYGPYDPKTEQYYCRGMKPDEVKRLMESGENVEKSADEVVSENAAHTRTAEEEENHKKLVNILIDKTGYGLNPIEITEDEKKVIYESDEILLTSVKKLDLSTIRINEKDPDAPKRSFQETARAHQLSGSHVDVAFAISGFHAQMKGLSYGDLTDLAIDPENITFNEIYKQATVIYNNMVNLSRPAFKDIDDFLTHFAWQDLDMAIYALYVATFPEIQSMGMRCGGCQASFNWNFRTRTLLNFDRSPDRWMELYRKVIMATPFEQSTVLREAPLNNTTMVELPMSKYIIEFGPITLYDYLYKVLPIGDDDQFKAIFGDNPSNHIKMDLFVIPAIRRILVPDGKGGHDPYDTLKDMIDILGDVSPDETKIIRAIASKTLAGLAPTFGLSGIKCPKCGTVTEFLSADVSDMVFRAYTQQENTTVDVEKLHLI